MGMQQILLIILSVIIVSISIIGAVGLFKLRAEKANRAAIILDMHEMAMKSIAYFKTPANMGGGDGSWNPAGFYVWSGYPISDDERYLETNNGRILISERSNGRLLIKGWGTELGYDEENAIRAQLILSGTTGEMTFTLLN